MSKLVSVLKEDHKKLLAALDKIKTAGITTPDGRRLLNDIKGALLGHLRKEEAELYPALRKAGAQYPEAQQLADRFEAEMKGIGRDAVAFFEKYNAESTGMDFARDLGRLLGALGTRIRREEAELYPAYDKYVT